MSVILSSYIEPYWILYLFGLVTDICMDKEPDGVVVYANNGDSCNPIQENVSVLPPLDIVPSDEDNGNTELLSTEESIEVKEYDVKECTNEIPVAKPLEDGNMEIATLRKDAKSVNKSVLHAKHVSKPGRGSNKIRNTVPQPFALATAKRASSATRESHEVADMYSKIQKQVIKVRILCYYKPIYTLLNSQFLF